MEQGADQQPSARTQWPTEGPAVEHHGRAVTANQRAAAWYRLAQQATGCRLAADALRLAVTADPGFRLAAADLNALDGTMPPEPGRRQMNQQMNWERHHMEIVGAAVAGEAGRAADLLREHLANVGCDPLASRIAAHRRPAGPAITDRLPACHPTTCNCRA
jgi:DNA-binding GntR family transcriptional regulator